MKGSIIKRTNTKGKRTYYAVIEDRQDGKRQRKWHSDPNTGSAFTNRGAAEKHLAKLVDAMNEGTYVASDSITVKDYSKTWLAQAKDRLKPSTYSSYEKNLRVHVWPTLGDTGMQSLSTAQLDALYAQLRLDGKQVKGHDPSPLSVRTVAYVHTITKAMLSDAAAKGLIVRNPAETATPPKTQAHANHDMTTWNPYQVSVFLEGTREHRYGPLLTILALGGVRRGEALGIRWSDIDFDANRISITSTVGRVGGRIVEGATKTGAGRRPIAIDPVVVAALREQESRQDHQKGQLLTGYNDQGLVFAGVTGEYLNPEHVSRVFKTEAERLHLPEIRLHDLRHTWATLALQAGIHPRVVQERLGHANVTITLQLYSHVAPTMHDEAAATVSNLITASNDPKVTQLRASR